MLKFTKDHEWLRLEGEVATVGITNYAQEQLGDLVFVEFPAAGKTVEPGAVVAVVESVKAASEVYSPVKGEVIEVNQEITASPDLVNTAPMDGGWMFKIRLANPADVTTLMDEADYIAQIT
jgi:glycine cleavage system H protein